MPQCHGPGVAPTVWVHWPESQDKLWDTEEELPGTVYDFLCGFSRGKKVAKCKGLRDPRSMLKLRDKRTKVNMLTSSLSVSLTVSGSFIVLLNFFLMLFSG